MLLWKYTTGSGVISSPAVANGVVYVGSADNNVYALNASTGVLMWKYTTGNAVESSPAVANGVLYVGSYDHNLYALNASTGVLLWNFTTLFAFVSSPAVANGVVYVGSDDGSVYGLNATTGALLWKYMTGSTDSAVESSPAVVNGVVYVGSFNSDMYAFTVPLFSDLGPPGDPYNCCEAWVVAGSGALGTSVTAANLFTVSGGGNFDVTQVDLGVNYISGTNAFYASIWTNSDGLPGAQVTNAYWPALAAVNYPSLVTISGISGVTLTGGQSYS